MIQTRQVKIENGYLSICQLSDGSERMTAHESVESLMATVLKEVNSLRTPTEEEPIPNLPPPLPKLPEDDVL